jgi:hypothetical protein
MSVRCPNREPSHDLARVPLAIASTAHPAARWLDLDTSCRKYDARRETAARVRVTITGPRFGRPAPIALARHPALNVTPCRSRVPRARAARHPIPRALASLRLTNTITSSGSQIGALSWGTFAPGSRGRRPLLGELGGPGLIRSPPPGAAARHLSSRVLGSTHRWTVPLGP